MLISPFADLFFQNLQLYISNEYIPHGIHDFIFQIMSSKRPGKPLCTAGYSSIYDNFKRAVLHTSIPDGERLSPHSLRHMYGVYMLNYCPNMDGGYGFPLETVRIFMGHKDIESTKKYAQKDKDLIAVELEYANKIMRESEFKSIQQIKVEVFQNGLDRAMALVEIENRLK